MTALSTVTRFFTDVRGLPEASAPGPDAALLDEGYLDSLGMLELVEFLEAEFGVTITDDDLTPDHFHSVQTVAELMDTKRAG